MLIKRLTEADGLPAHEEEIRELIKKEIQPYADRVTVDILGNIIAEKNIEGKGPHIGLAAHMDEVGMVVTYIEESGLLRFHSWGCDLRVLPAKVVRIGKNKIPGVIGSKPIHLQKSNERKKAIPLDNLYIDIGAQSKSEAQKVIALGDYVAFDSEMIQFGNNKIKGKALDDRVGCAVLIEMLKSNHPYKITAAFNVQEEVGTRGSVVTANKINADLFINIEGTIASDIYDIPAHQHITTLGKGPAISLVDSSSVYLQKYVKQMVETATENQIPYQYRRTSVGGTDAGNYHMAKEGTPVIGISVPCRYIHTPVSVMDKNDFNNTILLVETFIKEFNE